MEKNNIVAIVGRPNVGKSTLFNRLTRSRYALVDDQPGVTRDRIFKKIVYNDVQLTIVDTGGFEDSSKDPISEKVKKQVEQAIEEADKIIFVLDARDGITPLDEELANILRKRGKEVIVAANKIDSSEHEPLCLEFYKLGLGKVYPISAAHGRGIKALMDEVVKGLPKRSEPEEEKEKDVIKVAVVGRPNVGKSSFINKVIGEERLIVSEIPGTTRDSVDIRFSYQGKDYILIDTAGIRRKSRVKEKLEKFSVVKSLNSLERCDVAIIMIDATEGVTEQDAHLCGYAHEQGKGLIIVVNKWDLIKKDQYKIKAMMDSIERRLKFVDYAPRINISALTGENVGLVFKKVDLVYKQINTRIKTSVVNEGLQEILRLHPPPMKGGKILKLYYATQVDVMPPTFVIFANNPKWVTSSYERFLINQFRERFGLENSPIKLVFKERPRRR